MIIKEEKINFDVINNNQSKKKILISVLIVIIILQNVNNSLNTELNKTSDKKEEQNKDNKHNNNTENKNNVIAFDFTKEKENFIKEIIKEQKKEENNNSTNKIQINPFIIKQEEKIEQVTQKSTLNTPGNPFLSVTNIITNEEVFKVNSLNQEKDETKSINITDITSNRNTMDNSNTFIKSGGTSNMDNSNSSLF